MAREKLSKDFVLPFGKHEGMTLGEVSEKHPNWLLWFHKENKRKVKFGLTKGIFAFIQENYEDLEKAWNRVKAENFRKNPHTLSEAVKNRSHYLNDRNKDVGKKV